MQSLQSAFGVAVLLAGLAILLLKVPPIRAAFAAVNGAVDAISAASRAGSSFVFGYLGGAPLPFEPKFPGSEFILAFQALPIVLVMSVLTTLLFYWKILPPEWFGRHARRRFLLRFRSTRTPNPISGSIPAKRSATTGSRGWPRRCAGSNGFTAISC